MSDDAGGLLRQARASLDDARLLAEHRRPNEAVLTRLALCQALRAISVSEGLEADDTLRLDTLLRRVPPDHPQAALVSGLRDDAAPTIAAVAGLVEALARPPVRPERQPSRAPRRREADAGPGAGADADPESDPSAATALEASPRGEGRHDAAASYPSAAFWTLMDRWRVPDLEALALIGHEGGLTRKGTRPRFRLQGDEAGRYAGLRALDQALQGLGLDPGRWLETPLASGRFDGGSPLAALRRDPDAAPGLLRLLRRQGLRTTLGGG